MSLQYDNEIGFDRVLDAFSANVKRLALMRVRRLARKLFTKIVQGTPVKLGRLRASWKLSLGAPYFGIEEPPKEGFSITQATEIAMQQVDNIKDFKDPKTQGIYITNGVPYAEIIEDGDGERGPVGMLESAVAGVKFLANEGGESE